VHVTSSKREAQGGARKRGEQLLVHQHLEQLFHGVEKPPRDLSRDRGQHKFSNEYWHDPGNHRVLLGKGPEGQHHPGLPNQHQKWSPSSLNGMPSPGPEASPYHTEKGKEHGESTEDRTTRSGDHQHDEETLNKAQKLKPVDGHKKVAMGNLYPTVPRVTPASIGTQCQESRV
jgi:hypothetical protein